MMFYDEKPGMISNAPGDSKAIIITNYFGVAR
jgi:hypothetical protein